MILEQITKFVIPFSKIPKELIGSSWLLKYPKHAFVEAHLDEEEDHDALSEWIVEKYPELEKEDSFFIHIDQ